MERKLTVILAADVVGYSALMERDEAGTFDRLTADRKELFEPEIEKRHGRIFKLMGDGLLAEFGSVVDAVECAVSLQRGLVERYANDSGSERIQVRIGVNLGEVIVDGEDRYGEGVNVAARLEQLAEPGGICVSGKVVIEIDNKLAFGFESMGDQKVKNISNPVAAYRVVMEGSILAAPLAKPLALPTKPPVAVLPFTNMSGDPEQEYFADGLVEDLTTSLSKIRGLFVIARNSSFAYKGQPVDVRKVAADLGVRYILEGSVRKAANRVRITGQLVEGANATMSGPTNSRAQSTISSICRIGSPRALSARSSPRYSVPKSNGHAASGLTDSTPTISTSGLCRTPTPTHPSTATKPCASSVRRYCSTRTTPSRMRMRPGAINSASFVADSIPRTGSPPSSTPTSHLATARTIRRLLASERSSMP